MVTYAKRVSEEQNVVGIGINQKEIVALRKGKPISLDLAGAGYTDLVIVLFYGGTDAQMRMQVNSMNENGRVDNDPPDPTA